MLSIIVAYDQNRVIGFQNKMPWFLPEDLHRVKTLTNEKTIIMGRRTFESIGKALPDRHNVVLTRDKNWHADGVETVSSLDRINERYANAPEESYVFGGQAIFVQLLPFVDKIYATVLQASFEGDRFFPELDMEEWDLIGEEAGQGAIPHTYQTYMRRKIDVSSD